MPLTAAEGAVIDRLARGEAVPGAKGACVGCHHAQVWHRPGTRLHACMVPGCGCKAIERKRNAAKPAR